MFAYLRARMLFTPGLPELQMVDTARKLQKCASIGASLEQDMLDAVYAAIDEVNAQSNGGAMLPKTPDARLLGGEHGVDSLTFVNLIVALEEQIQNRLGKSVVLVNEDSMALRDHPFRTVGTLAKYAGEIVATAD